MILGLKKRALVTTALTLILSGIALSAAAQPAQPEAEVVIVTAQKRAQSLQSVPVSVGVIQSVDIERKGLTRAIDAALEMPGVNFQVSNEARSAAISVRGIGSNGNAEGFEPSVVAVVDGEVYARTDSLLQNLLDVERVEVLRGPQGTLFGKNSSSGAIQVVTKRPKLDDQSGYLVATLADHDEHSFKASGNIPVGEKFAMRISGYNTHIGGWLPNAAPMTHTLGRENSGGARGQFLFQPTEDFNILLRADYSLRKSNGGPNVLIKLDNSNVKSFLEGLGQPVGYDARVGGIDRRQSNRTENKGAGVEVTKNFGTNELKYLAFVRQFDLTEQGDLDSMLIDAGPSRLGGYVNTKTTQQELRLTTDGAARLSFIGGLFYYHSVVARYATTETCTQLSNLSLDTGGMHATNRTYVDPVTYSVTDCQGAGTSPTNSVSYFDSDVTTHNTALFGQFTFKATEKLNLFAGARSLHESSKIDFVSTSVTTPYTDKRDDSAFIYRVGGQYYLSPDVNVFASYSTGYKGVSWNNTNTATVAELSPGGSGRLDPEKSKQVELGLRSQFFNRHLTVNLTAFDLRTRDFQEQVRRARFEDPSNPTLVTSFEGVTVNAGEVRSRGIEWDLAWRPPVEGLSLGLTGAHQKATYEDFGGFYQLCPNALVGTPRCQVVAGSSVMDPTGESLPRAPEWEYRLSANYSRPVGDWLLNINSSYKWSDSYYFDVVPDPERQQEAFGIWDASTTLTAPGGKYVITVYGRNLDNTFYYSSINNRAAAVGGGLRAGIPRNYERFFGLNLRVNF